MTHLEMVCSEQDLPALPAQVWSPGTEEVRLAPVSWRCEGPGPHRGHVTGRHHAAGSSWRLGGRGDDGPQRVHPEALGQAGETSSLATAGQNGLCEGSHS